MSDDAIFCEHANEAPALCPCRGDCYCRENTCAPSPADEVILPAPYSDAEIEERAARVIRDTEIPVSVIDPAHYRQHPSGIECIQITEHMNFCVGNAMKYLWRAGLKPEAAADADLKKARWYIQREMMRLGYDVDDS